MKQNSSFRASTTFYNTPNTIYKPQIRKRTSVSIDPAVLLMVKEWAKKRNICVQIAASYLLARATIDYRDVEVPYLQSPPPPR